MIKLPNNSAYTSFDLSVWEINKLYLIHLYGIVVINTQTPQVLITSHSGVKVTSMYL